MSPAGHIAQGSALYKLRQHVFEFATTTVFFLVALNYFLDPEAGERSSLGKNLHPFDYAWTGMYAVAFPFIVYGLLKGEQRFRVSGLVLLGTGTTMNFIAAITVDPLEARDFTYLTFASACFIRAFFAVGAVHNRRSTDVRA